MRGTRARTVGLLACFATAGAACDDPAPPSPVPAGAVDVPARPAARADETAIRALVDAELAREGLDRTDRLGIAGPPRAVRAGEIRFLPYSGGRTGTVTLTLAPRPGGPAVPVLVSLGFTIAVGDDGAARVTRRVSPEQVRAAIVLATGTEQPALQAATARLQGLPVSLPATARTWADALSLVRLDPEGHDWSLFFDAGPTGRATPEERLMIDLDADTRAITVIAGVDTLAVARQALTAAGHDATAAQLVIINPAYERALPAGVTHAQLLSSWVVRATGVRGHALPLWVALRKYTLDLDGITEAADPQP